MVSDFLNNASASDVSRRFGRFYAEATRHPLAVERNGEARVVMLPAAEYERLARLDHVSMQPSELERSDLAALRDAVVPESARELDRLLD